MATTLFTSSVCLAHDNGPGHPESPDRLIAVLAELNRQPTYAALKRQTAPRASLAEIARVHDATYISGIFSRIPDHGIVALDGETSLSPASGEAALHAAGAIIAAIDLVFNKDEAPKLQNAFCAIRPPGHHAAVPPSSGFCLFNNIAIGAAHAMAEHNVKRIAIVDFDVHHGNGTEAWAKQYPDVLFISSHQFPLWPGSGRSEDKGLHGNIVNIPLAPGTGSMEFRLAMQNMAFSVIKEFKPELIMISAGFDAYHDDPLANMQLVEDDYFWVTAELCKLAAHLCDGRVVSTLEGGYNIAALAKSAGAHVRALMAA